MCNKGCQYINYKIIENLQLIIYNKGTFMYQDS
jgi:hypothetical protein